MSETLAYNRTVPAFPLGQPVDGRPRYGMTPEQAFIYRWVVRNKPHNAAFLIGFRELAMAMASRKGTVFNQVSELVARGWLEAVTHTKARTRYRLVHPVMNFRSTKGK